jgi:hypothetical protein
VYFVQHTLWFASESNFVQTASEQAVREEHVTWGDDAEAALMPYFKRRVRFCHIGATEVGLVILAVYRRGCGVQSSQTLAR